MKAVLMPHGEGVVQIVIQRSAGHQEIPALNAVSRIGGAIEACLVVSDRARKLTIHGHGGGRARVVEINRLTSGFGRSMTLEPLDQFWAIRCFFELPVSVSAMICEMCSCHSCVTPPA